MYQYSHIIALNGIQKVIIGFAYEQTSIGDQLLTTECTLSCQDGTNCTWLTYSILMFVAIVRTLSQLL